MKTILRFRRQRLALPVVAMAVFMAGPVQSADSPVVTASNYVRAETDVQMRGYIDNFGSFGKFHHNRQPYDVNNQVTVRGNRDTLYSFGVFDLTSPITVTLPETGGRYQSLMIVTQDHSIYSFYGPRTGTVTEEKAGTRYVFLVLRTFMDPSDEDDLQQAYRLQDAVVVEQDDMGTFEVPDWDEEEVAKMRATINVVSSTVSDSSKMFGRKDQLDPVYWLLGAAFGWGGLPSDAATYASFFPEQNDGKTPYTLTVTDVPVYGFWSVTLYDGDGFMPINEYNAYSYNNVTARKGRDGSITIHFGGDPQADNFLPIVPGWNYVVRMYQPGPEILKGNWSFPTAEPAK